MTGFLTNDQRLTKGSTKIGRCNLFKIRRLTGMTGKPNLFWVSQPIYTNTINTYIVLILFGQSGQYGQRIHFQQIVKPKSDRNDQSDRNFFVKIENRPK